MASSDDPDPQDGETDGAIGLLPNGKLNIVEPGSPRTPPRIVPDDPTWQDFMSEQDKALGEKHEGEEDDDVSDLDDIEEMLEAPPET